MGLKIPRNLTQRQLRDLFIIYLDLKFPGCMEMYLEELMQKKQDYDKVTSLQLSIHSHCVMRDERGCKRMK